jgi:L-amino acid N-acyltransferase YncA
MEIRHADPCHDAAACAAIYAPYVRETVISFELEAPDEKQFARRIESYSRTHAWLVADVGGEVVAFAYGCPHRERPAYRWAADVSVYVARGHHRQGIGRQLYGALLALLTRQGMHVACAGVTLPNDASVGLHESLGFTPVGVYRRIGYKNGAWWDVGWWQLELRRAGDAPPDDPRRTATRGARRPAAHGDPSARRPAAHATGVVGTMPTTPVDGQRHQSGVMR